MTFIADLHIHSRFSRATARNLDPENLYIAARKKGITVVGTGDFTHPGWYAELGEKLEPAEPGLFRLKKELETACEALIADLPEKRPVRFLLSSEISNIYKKDGATRKIHHLVFLPDFSAVKRFNARLSDIGNIRADGRPILGLDSRNLLEIALETNPNAYLIPAHIWTPWFSLYGSKSGFNSIRECFEDLSEHIFAIETGLSSDPPMNWRVKDLDGITMVSNSDAHSPANLGREANLFDTELSYEAIHQAMKTGDPDKFLGTLEFFPEEGKYHQDGHRKCGVNYHPRQSLAENDICPVCGQGLTLGVLHRVEALAGRPEGEKPPLTHPFYSLIPLAEILSELLRVGPKSKKVQTAYEKTISLLGPELDVLLHASADSLDTAGVPLLGEAVTRMREGRVHLDPGFDGQYGRVTAFAPDEQDRLLGQKNLFPAGKSGEKAPDKARPKEKSTPKSADRKTEDKKPEATQTASKHRGLCAEPSETTGCALAKTDPVTDGLNDAQKQAVLHPGGPMLIVAGPGTGKTRTLTCRIARLVRDGHADPGRVLAVTFTNKAAREMTERLQQMTGRGKELPLVSTFHALCFFLLREIENTPEHTVADDSDRDALVREAVRDAAGEATGKMPGESAGGQKSRKPDAFARCIGLAKQRLLTPDDDLTQVCGEIPPELLAAVFRKYQELLCKSKRYDYDDLIPGVVGHMDASTDLREDYRQRFTHIFIDEYQDLNYAQYRLVRLLAPQDGELCVIGDPDQSIYGFTGADAAFFRRFIDDYPSAAVIRLDQNYRSTATILEAADRTITGHSIDDRRRPLVPNAPGATGSEEARINLLKVRSDVHEAVCVGKTIENWIGGLDLSYDDFGKRSSLNASGASFSDFAVIYRTRAQGDIFAETFGKAGIPFRRADRQSFMNTPGIREILCAVKLMEGLGSIPDLARLIRWKIPDFESVDLEALASWGYSNGYMANGILAEAHRLAIDGISPRGRDRMNEFLDLLAGIAEETDALPAEKKIDRIAGALIDERSGSGKEYEDALSFLKQTAISCGGGPEAFINAVALRSDPDFADPAGEKVTLMTMHAAKGLEFPVVFITGCEDGLIPLHHRREPTDLAEERRLFYVALTRARRAVYLCCSENRSLYGKTENLPPSSFLLPIRDMLVERQPEDAARPRSRQVQLTLFS